MKEELNKTLEKLENENANKQALGYEALALIKEILSETPYDLDVIIIRMRINSNVFENSSKIIDDATFIIENNQFGKDKMVGYNWLFWLYANVMEMPGKAIEVIEEQLIELHSLFSVKSQKDKIESELFDKWAYLKFQNEEKEEALKLWHKAYKKYPYFDNNAFVGIQFLEEEEFEIAEEILITHFNWSFQYEDGFRLKYGIKLKELYESKKIENHPNLIGLLFNIIRNEDEYFKTEGKLDFYEKYYPELEKWVEKHPNNTLLLTASAHTHFFDTKNYEKAFQIFKKVLASDRSLQFTSLDRLHKVTKKTKNNFFELPFRFEGLANDMYSNMTALDDFLDKTKKKKKKKKYSKLAIQYGEVGYNQFKNYLGEGNDDTYSNHPYIFAMLCNNYANALGKYADLNLKKKERVAYYSLAGDIHIEGYEMSPFSENLENASIDYFKGKKYKKSIQYSLKSIEVYREELSVYDFQYHYWQIARSYIALDEANNVHKYYLKAKELHQKVGKGSKDANSKFIFTAKLTLEYAIIKKQRYKESIAELEWFLNQKIALSQEPNEHGLISHYLGVCYKNTNEKEKALKAFQVAVDYLQEADWGFYDTKCEEAETYIQELGGKVVKKKKQKKKTKSWFKRVTRKLLFPFIFIALIGGIIYAAMKGKHKAEEEKEG